MVGHFSLKPPGSVSLCQHRSRVHSSYSVLPKGQFVDTRMNAGCEGSPWRNKNILLIFFWRVQRRQHQQGPADHTEGDLRWSQPWKGKPRPCLHHFNSSSESLLSTWGLARCSPPPGGVPPSPRSSSSPCCQRWIYFLSGKDGEFTVGLSRTHLIAAQQGRKIPPVGPGCSPRPP